MDTFLRFLYELVNHIVSGFYSIVKGLIDGIKQILNFPAFYNLVTQYKGDFTGAEWAMVAITILFMLVFYGGITSLIVFAVRKLIKRLKPVSKNALLDEVDELNRQVLKLSKEKDEILAMKVSQLGLKPNETYDEPALATEGNAEAEEGVVGETGIRFSKLNLIDMEYADYKVKNYGNSFDLPELCSNFRNFAASKLKLYYKDKAPYGVFDRIMGYDGYHYNANCRDLIAEGYKKWDCLFCGLKESKEDEKNLILNRGETCFCVMNLFPYNNGHLMVAPYRHLSSFEELLPNELSEMTSMIQKEISILKKLYNPNGFNVGMNIGTAAGAGVAGHLHWHIVPRWSGDSNFMPVIGKTDVVSVSLSTSYKYLKEVNLNYNKD